MVDSRDLLLNGRWQPFLNDSLQLIGVHRFAYVIVHSGCNAIFPAAFHRVSGHGDYWHMLAGMNFIVADDFGCFKATHVRHLDIHENKRVWELCKSIDCGLPVFGNVRLKAEIFEQQDRNLLVDLVIINNKDEFGSDR